MKDIRKTLNTEISNNIQIKSSVNECKTHFIELRADWKTELTNL